MCRAGLLHRVRQVPAPPGNISVHVCAFTGHQALQHFISPASIILPVDHASRRPCRVRHLPQMQASSLHSRVYDSTFSPKDPAVGQPQAASAVAEYDHPHPWPLLQMLCQYAMASKGHRCLALEHPGLITTMLPASCLFRTPSQLARSRPCPVQGYKHCILKSPALKSVCMRTRSPAHKHHPFPKLHSRQHTMRTQML